MTAALYGEITIDPTVSTGVYAETVTATDVDGRNSPGINPLALRCDTPGHGDVFGNWATAGTDGWDLGVLHPAQLRLCPQCVTAIRDATSDAVQRGAEEEAAKCAPVPDWKARNQMTAYPLPRWTAATPAAARPRKGATIPASLYGTYGDSAALSRLFDACDKKFGPLDHTPTAAHTVLTVQPEPEPVPEVPHEDEDADGDGPFGELDEATEQHLAVLLNSDDTHDGNTSVFPAITDETEVLA